MSANSPLSTSDVSVCFHMPSSLQDQPTRPGESLYVLVDTTGLLPQMVKIGSAISPSGHARSLSQDHPFKLRVAHQYKQWGFLRDKVHKKLEETRVGDGDGNCWFSLDASQADLAIRYTILEYQMAIMKRQRSEAHEVA
jgi:hypothetical protein